MLVSWTNYRCPISVCLNSIILYPEGIFLTWVAEVKNIVYQSWINLHKWAFQHHYWQAKIMSMMVYTQSFALLGPMWENFQMSLGYFEAFLWHVWVHEKCKSLGVKQVIDQLAAAAAKFLQWCLTLCNPIDISPPGLSCPWDSPGKNTGVGCHFLLQCMKVKSESEVTQSCLTVSDPMDSSLPGSSVHGILEARVLEWGAIAFSNRPA